MNDEIRGADGRVCVDYRKSPFYRTGRLIDEAPHGVLKVIV